MNCKNCMIGHLHVICNDFHHNFLYCKRCKRLIETHHSLFINE